MDHGDAVEWRRIGHGGDASDHRPRLLAWIWHDNHGHTAGGDGLFQRVHVARVPQLVAETIEQVFSRAVGFGVSGQADNHPAPVTTQQRLHQPQFPSLGMARQVVNHGQLVAVRSSLGQGLRCHTRNLVPGVEPFLVQQLPEIVVEARQVKADCARFWTSAVRVGPSLPLLKGGGNLGVETLPTSGRQLERNSVEPAINNTSHGLTLVQRGERTQGLVGIIFVGAQ